MKSVNRYAIVVRTKQPFFDWAGTLDGGLPNSTNPWTSVCLVTAPDDEGPEKILRGNFAVIFEEQLESWHTDKET
jgi:hypothetical protein